jgi:Domain of unknown function (DUF4276)
MRELVFCLEEPSAKRFLEGVVDRMNVQKIPVRYIVFEGKQDLEAQLERRLRGYRNVAASFIVMRDQDGEPNCQLIKDNITQICARAGRADAIVRIACRELEAFYWGDLQAVEEALCIRNLVRYSRTARYRNSDDIPQPARELQKITKGGYQKMSGSEQIGRRISFNNCTSRSFQALRMSIAQCLV